MSKLNGIKKGQYRDSIISDTELKAVGKKLSESFMTNTLKTILKISIEKEGFLNTKVALNTIKDTLDGNMLTKWW